MTRRRIAVLTAAVVLSVMLACGGLLQFGSPTWHWRIYVHQAYVFPGYPEGDIAPPPEYTGIWVKWYEDGQLLSEESYVDGIQHGEYTLWLYDGKMVARGAFKDGNQDGQEVVWHDTGVVGLVGQYVNGKPDGVWTAWTRDGKWRCTRCYAEGKEVAVSDVVRQGEHLGAFAEEVKRNPEPPTDEPDSVP